MSDDARILLLTGVGICARILFNSCVSVCIWDDSNCWLRVLLLLVWLFSFILLLPGTTHLAHIGRGMTYQKSSHDPPNPVEINYRQDSYSPRYSALADPGVASDQFVDCRLRLQDCAFECGQRVVGLPNSAQLIRKLPKGVKRSRQTVQRCT